jgi:hypothetical protein
MTALAPATSVPAEEKSSLKTCTEISNATVVANVAEVEQLDCEINSIALSIVGDFERRVKTELLPRLYRMRSVLPHGQWGKWYGAFCDRHRIQWSIRDVQRKFKQLEDGWKQDPVRINNSKNAAVIQAAKNLANAKAQFSKSADGGNLQAKAHLSQYEKEYADAVAEVKNSDTTEKPSPEIRVNKRLAAIVEVGEKYIRVMERVVYSDAVTLNDRQRRDLEKAAEQWRRVLRDARELSFAVKIIEGKKA